MREWRYPDPMTGFRPDVVHTFYVVPNCPNICHSAWGIGFLEWVVYGWLSTAVKAPPFVYEAHT